MRKTVLFSAAVAALFVGSIFIGVAVATTGAPVLYDARSPQPVATESDGFGVEAGGVQSGEPRVPADGAYGNDDSPLPSAPSTPPVGDPGTPPAPGPSPTPGPPADPEPTADEQQAWLGFQQLVRECMTTAGQEYRYWEWWNTEPRNPTSTAPAMSDDLTAEQQAAWHVALEGDGNGVDGCITEATHADQEPPASATPPPAESDAPPAESDAPPAEGTTPPAETESPVVD